MRLIDLIIDALRGEKRKPLRDTSAAENRLDASLSYAEDQVALANETSHRVKRILASEATRNVIGNTLGGRF